MENPKRRKISEEEINKAYNEILEEDRQENADAEDSESSSTGCRENDCAIKRRVCECTRIAENTARFSLRVMESMRCLQREDALFPTSTIEDIVNYIEANYRDEGDLYAQVRTALKQVCSQGFVAEFLEGEYHLVGPIAGTMNRIDYSNDNACCPLPVQRSVKGKLSKRKGKDSKMDDSDVCDCEVSASTNIRSANLHAQKIKNDREKNDTSSEESWRCSCALGSSNESFRRRSHNVETNEMDRDASSKTRKSRRLSGVESNSDNRRLEERYLRMGLPKEKATVSGHDWRHWLSRGTWAPLNRMTNQKPNVAAQQSAALSSPRAGDETPKRGTANDVEIDDRDETSESLHDINRQVRGQDVSTRSKEREKELKRWIKRCKEECERQGRR